MSKNPYRQKLEAYFQGKRARGEPLPGIRGCVNYQGISIETGIPSRQFRWGSELRLLVDEATKTLGVANGTPNEQPRRLLDSGTRTPVIAYGDLKTSGLIWLREHGYSKASIASYQSHLNAFMRNFGRTDRSSTAENFGVNFGGRLNAFMKAAVRSKAARSAMISWSRIHYELHQSVSLPSSFASALTELVRNSGRTQRDIARAVGIRDPDTLGDWIRGNRTPRDPEHVARLEEVLNVLPGTLGSKLVFWRVPRGTNIPSEWWPESWRKNFSNSLHRRDKLFSLIPEHVLMGPLDELKPAFNEALRKV